MVPADDPVDPETLLLENAGWVLEKKGKFDENRRSAPSRTFEEGEAFPFLGEDHRVTVADVSASEVRDGELRLSAERVADSSIRSELETLYRREAQEHLTERVEAFSGRTEVEPGRVEFRNQRTRWGSCSTNRTISLNWRLIMTPPEVIDYVVVHELAHLRVEKHTRRFWGLVREQIPDYPEYAEWLEENSARLIFAVDDLYRWRGGQIIVSSFSENTVHSIWSPPMDKLNYFEPYDADPSHENQLTRAYLVVLRLVPMALADFLNLVREDQKRKGYEQILPSLSELGRAMQAETQTGSLAEHKSHGLSLLMTNEHFEPSEPVGVREGRAVYDGVLTFDQHVLTLENKPQVRDVWEGQLSPSLSDREIPLTFEEKEPLVVSWRDVIDRLASLKASDRLPPASAGLVGDFLEYVAEYFDYLNPYYSFRVCDRSENRLNERCRQVLAAIGREERIHPGHHGGYKLELDGKPAREIYLRARVDEDEDASIRTSVHPGDLTGQARAFYDAVDRDAIVELAESGSWRVELNLHLSFRGTHLVYSSVEGDPGAYIDYWRNHRDRIGQTRGDNSALKAAVSELVADSQLNEEDFAQFEREFLETDRNHVNVNPGISFRYWWPLEKAKQLDESGRFVSEYRETVIPVLKLWGQSLPSPAN